MTSGALQHHLDADGCPVCLQTLDAASAASGAAPRPHSVALCYYCGTMLEWDDDMRLVRLTDTTLATLGADTQRKLHRIGAFIRRRRKYDE